MAAQHVPDQDTDVEETKDWLDAMDAVVAAEGPARARFLLQRLLAQGKKLYNIDIADSAFQPSDYVNTIPERDTPPYPGDLAIEERIEAAVRWNAVMMVLRASRKGLDLGGHLASFQSAATLYEVGQHHFFRADCSGGTGDLVYFQGHSAPGIYARAFVEGRLTAAQLDRFRQEVGGQGLPSYPHPKWLPEFWQFPTVSMGLGAVSAIYQARLLKYLHHRKLKGTEKQKVYAFLGDGEMNEPESKGALTVAARDQLDNLIFVVNCNLQGLDGPVTGNGKIIQELEGRFLGAGWQVIKVIWGGGWDSLLARDRTGQLVKLLNETLDGDYQTFRARDPQYLRTAFFGRYPETARLVADWRDEELWELSRGGHDRQKVFAAFQRAQASDRPTVILAKTIKGYGLGRRFESTNTVHQVKKMSPDDVRAFRDRFDIPVKDDRLGELPYYRFPDQSPEACYLHERRQALGGYLPARLTQPTTPLASEGAELALESLLGPQSRPISTTLAFVRILNVLLKDKRLGPRVVPILADEARTFGMEGLFRQLGIYHPRGQQYLPQDRAQVAYYRESQEGQVLQEGINELGAAAMWLAAATAYSNLNFPLIPCYIYYSMFGFQRVGDLLWAAGDQQARGFLIGGTSGRTTLNGEGLQHADGHSHVQALTIPNCVAYDPAYACELAVIIRHGLRRLTDPVSPSVFYYITITNEPYEHPGMPEGVEHAIVKGLYRCQTLRPSSNAPIQIQLLGSGAVLPLVIEAGKKLCEAYGIGCDVYSVTSFTELARDGQRRVRWNLLHPDQPPRVPFVTQQLKPLPTVAATDYMKLFADQIRAYLPSPHYHVLGTDGFGRSDSRENLRHYFEISAHHVIVAALWVLYQQGSLPKTAVLEAIQRFGLPSEKGDPLDA